GGGREGPASRSSSPKCGADSSRRAVARRTGNRSRRTADSEAGRRSGYRPRHGSAPREADEGRRRALRQRICLGCRDGGDPVSAVAKRYAKALLSLGTESGEGESIGRELDGVAQAFATGPLQVFANDTTLDRKTRRAVAARVGELLGVSRLLRNFLGVLAENNRLRDLPAIRGRYERLEDDALGRARARVLSARPISEESRARINEIFERQTGRRVIAETAVVPDLLGGAVVRIQGRVFDGSLRTQLEHLRLALSG